MVDMNIILGHLPSIYGNLGVAGDRFKFLATKFFGIVKFASMVISSLVIIDCVDCKMLTSVFPELRRAPPRALKLFFQSHFGASKQQVL
jgi:hypothetical protein